MQNEYKLNVTTWDVGRDGRKFCTHAFKKCVDLPDGVTKVILVLDKKLTEDGFGIKKPVMTDSFFAVSRKQSSLTRIKGYGLYWETREWLAKAYDAGYRAVHIEYDV